MSARLLPLLAAVALTLPLTACTMNRTLRVETRPPGAHIWVNGELQEKKTPVDIPFTHYGRFSYRLEMDGYESAAGEIEIKARADGFPVIDLPLEMVTPDRLWRRTFDLQPLLVRPTNAQIESVRQRAEAFRERTEREAQEADTPGRSAPGRSRP